MISPLHFNGKMSVCVCMRVCILGLKVSRETLVLTSWVTASLHWLLRQNHKLICEPMCSPIWQNYSNNNTAAEG